MAAALHLLPDAADPLETILDQLPGGEPYTHRTAVVLPSARALAGLSMRLAAHGQGTAVSAGPYLFTLDDFIIRALLPDGRAFPGDFDRLSSLHCALRDCRAELHPLFKGAERDFLEDFLSFSAVGDRVLRFFDEVTAECVPFEEVRRHSAYTDFQAHVDILERIHARYHEVLELRGFTDRSRFKTTGKVDPVFASRFEQVFLGISGFLTRTEIRILKELCNLTNLRVILSHEGPFPAQYRELLDALELQASPLPVTVPSIAVPRIEEFPDPVSQAAFVEWAISDCLSAGIAEHRIAIVLPDEGFVETLSAVIGRDRLNIAMGLEMSRSLSVQLLRLFHTLFVERTPDGFATEGLLNLASHPLIKNIRDGAGSTARAELRELRRCMAEELRLRLTPRHLAKRFPFLHREISMMEERIWSAESLAVLCRNLLLHYRDIDHRLHPDFLKKIRANRDEGSARDRLTDLLAETNLADLSDPGPTVPLHRFSMILSRLQQARYPAVNRSGGIHVIGLLETRSLRFEAVIMPDVNEGYLPRRSEKDLFLNTSVRRSLALPSPEDREALFGIYFRQVLAGAHRSYLSYVRSPDRPLRSRYLEEFLLSHPHSGGPADFTPDSVRVRVVGGAKAQPVLRSEPVPKDAFTLGKLAGMTFSPSSIRQYLECPYRFFLEKVCGLRETPWPSDELPGWLKGEVFHAAVKSLYESCPHEELFRDSATHFRFLSDQVNRVARNWDPYRLIPVQVFALRTWIEKLKAFSENEVSLFRDGWRIVGLEQEVSAELGSGYRIKGKIDRLDQRDGWTRIVDYKTGALPMRKACRLSTARPGFTGIQLPVYALLASASGLNRADRIEGLYFYDLRDTFGLVNRFDEFIPGQAKSYLGEFEGFLETILDEIHDPKGSFRHAENPATCTYCPFDLVCRVHESGAAS